MKKRRSLLFAISGLFATLCGQVHAAKNYGRKKQILFLTYEGQRYEIPVQQKIVFIDLPPNKYFEIEAIDFVNVSACSKCIYAYRVPCIPSKPLHFALNKTKTAFVVYPKGIPWVSKQIT